MSTLALFPHEFVPLELSTDAQCTPKDLADDLGQFDLDPCSNPLSHIRAATKYMLERGEDGLCARWAPLWSVFCNGPYSDPMPWNERLRAHRGPWCALWKLDTTTEWFRVITTCGSTWAPFKKRLKFERNGNVGTAEFPSFLVWRDWTPSDAVLSRLWLPRNENNPAQSGGG